ncbi:MAG: hypothetical protein WDA22_15940 [Bacteroidota bacterium]
MKNILIFTCLFGLAAVLNGCIKENNSVEFGINSDNLLFASSTNLVILKGNGGSSVITGGIEPYSIMEIINGSSVSAQISGRQLQVNALVEGISSIKVKDSSSPSKTVTVTVSVKSTYTTNTAGILSFESNRGNFSVNGIAQYGINPPASGSGAIAIQDFQSITLFAYKVNSSTNIDVTMIEFESNTSNYSGTFVYPGMGKLAYISYFPNNNPNDSTYLHSGFILASSATASVESVTSTNIQGTFSGKGYSAIAGALYLNDKIDVTKGIFNIPLLQIGGVGETMVEKNVSKIVQKIFLQRKMY